MPFVIDETALIQLTPLVVELINEFKHRNDLVTEADVEPLLQSKLAKIRQKGQAFLLEKEQEKNNPNP